MSRLFFYSLSLALAGVFFQSCSSVSDSSPKEANQNQVPFGKADRVSMKVFARSSWQAAGFHVEAGEKFKITPSGSWTGGQLAIGDSTNDTQVISCGANGCNGDLLKNTQSHPLGDPDAYRVEEVDARGAAGGSQTNKMFVHRFYEENVLRNGQTNLSEAKAGYGGVNAEGVPLLDGKTICFSSNNTLLGASQVESRDLKIGYWYQRALAWQNTKNLLNLGAVQAGATLPTALSNALSIVIEIYNDATCENHPGLTQNLDDLKTQFEIFDQHSLWAQENVYIPTYFVNVPAGNYGEICRSNQDVILGYNYGQVANRLARNECAPGARNKLIMKIVADGERFEDVVPVEVGSSYEIEAYTASKRGWIYFKNNDPDTGISDNGTLDTSYLTVTLIREKTSN